MNEIYLYGTVGADFWGEDCFTAAMVREQLAAVDGAVTVRINSGGGIATEGQAIHTLLVDHAGQVDVIIDGAACSAASLIAMAGDTITVRRGAHIMIHDPAQWMTEGRGTEDDHLRAARALSVTAKGYARVYASRAGISVDQAREIMRAESWYEGADAVAAGFADSYDEDQAAAAVAQFDYRIYGRAPEPILRAGGALPREAAKTAVLAMIAGLPAQPNPKGINMSDQDNEEEMSADITAGDQDDALMVGDDEDEPQDAPAASDDDDEGAATASADRATARASAIVAVASNLGRPMSEAQKLIENKGLTVEAATRQMAMSASKENPMTEQPNRRQPAVITADERDKAVEGMTRSLLMKSRLQGGERNEFSARSLTELARESLLMSGITENFTDRQKMVGRAFTMSGGAHSTSDFANVLANVQGKAVLQGWDEAEEVFEMITRKGTLTDFKPTKRVGAGVFSSLPQIAEDGEYTYGTVGDRGEDIVLATYGKMLRITRQAIINDDLSILSDVPRRMGRAAKRTVGDLVFAILNGNPLMSDGVALFAAGHNNLASSGGAPSVTTFAAARTAMRTQKDGSSGKDDGAVLNIPTKYAVVPAALETTMRQLMASEYDPRDSKGHAMNPVAGAAEVVVDGRLDGTSATAWFVTADPEAFDTIEVAYLDGNDVPFVEEQTQWTTDGVEMKVRIDAAAKALDHRTMYKNAGA